MARGYKDYTRLCSDRWPGDNKPGYQFTQWCRVCVGRWKGHHTHTHTHTHTNGFFCEAQRNLVSETCAVFRAHVWCVGNTVVTKEGDSGHGKCCESLLFFAKRLWLICECLWILGLPWLICECLDSGGSLEAPGSFYHRS